MQPHKVVSREEWVAARKTHLANEKELTRLHVSFTKDDLAKGKVYYNYAMSEDGFALPHIA